MERSGPSQGPRLMCLDPTDNTGMLPSASNIHTSQVREHCITTVTYKESASILKTKHRDAQVSAEQSSGRGPDSSFLLAVFLHLGASLATRSQN